MKNAIVLLFLALSVTCSLQAQTKQDHDQIRAIFTNQEKFWNQGNIKAFMADYWQSDSLSFVGASGITYGFEPTYKNYLKRYPNRASMGTLRFEIKEITFITQNAAYLIGKYELARPQVGDKSGHFTVFLKKLDNKWVIVSDHSS